jgi:hypothetical protein
VQPTQEQPKKKKKKVSNEWVGVRRYVGRRYAGDVLLRRRAHDLAYTLDLLDVFWKNLVRKKT